MSKHKHKHAPPAEPEEVLDAAQNAPQDAIADPPAGDAETLSAVAAVSAPPEQPLTLQGQYEAIKGQFSGVPDGILRRLPLIRIKYKERPQGVEGFVARLRLAPDVAKKVIAYITGK